jgi:hypothetical protein
MAKLQAKFVVQEVAVPAALKRSQNPGKYIKPRKPTTEAGPQSNEARLLAYSEELAAEIHIMVPVAFAESLKCGDELKVTIENR